MSTDQSQRLKVTFPNKDEKQRFLDAEGKNHQIVHDHHSLPHVSIEGMSDDDKERIAGEYRATVRASFQFSHDASEEHVSGPSFP